MKPSHLLAFHLVALGLAATGVAQLPPVPTPVGNPTTADKANLGKVLFWDEQLSSTRTVACGTCHRPNAGGGDPRAAFAVHPGPDLQFGTADDIHGSPGVPSNLANRTYSLHPLFGLDVQVTGRNAPSAINAAFNVEQFWDGREGGVFNDPLTGAPLLAADASLESQAENPPIGDSEMAHQGRGWQNCADQITASRPLALATNIPAALDQWLGTRSYPELFTQVWGDPAVTPARIVMSIAAYERTLISDQTPFDLGTLTPSQQQGRDIFNDRGRCFLCHEGALFTDQKFHNIGLRPSVEDLGRFNVTGNTSDNGAFKTPGLRNAGLKTALMHNGIHRSLSEVIEFYDRGGDFFDNLDPLMQPLGLTSAEKVALLDFLQSGLTDARVATKLHPFDPPTLYSETTRVPRGYGSGGAGSGGVTPRLIAIEPPVIGNPAFTLAFADGMGLAATALAFDLIPGIGRPVLGVPIQLRGSGALVAVPLGFLQGTGAGQGHWSAPLAILNDPSMAGQSIFAQGYSLDPGATLGISGTAGLHITFFAPR